MDDREFDRREHDADLEDERRQQDEQDRYWGGQEATDE